MCLVKTCNVCSLTVYLEPTEVTSQLQEFPIGACLINYTKLGECWALWGSRSKPTDGSMSYSYPLPAIWPMAVLNLVAAVDSFSAQFLHNKG